MSGQSPEQRSSTPPYATLRAMSEGAAAATASAPAGAAATKPDVQYWRQEADKLDALLQTMWAGFVESDANGLPTALVDYVSAYTGAMRLKLTLMGYSNAPVRSARIAAAASAKARVP
jgi:hypothetical protein